MSNKSDFAGVGYVGLQMPYGSNRRAIRDNFAKNTGGTSQTLYDSDHESRKPSRDEVEKLFAETKDDEVLILLGSNAYSVENELLAFVVFNAEGWRYLTEEAYVHPKVLKSVAWRAIEFFIEK